MIFFLNLDRRSPSILEADIERNYVKIVNNQNLERNAYAKRQVKKCEVILQKVEMYKEKKNVEKCKKKLIQGKDLKKDQNQNKNPSYGKK